MQYSQDKKKNNTTFYAITAICLVAIALTTYIAISKNSAEEKKEQKSDSSVISKDDKAYNDSTEPEEKEPAGQPQEVETAPTETKAENIPYDEPAAEETEKKSEKRTFVMPTNGKIIKQYSEETLQYDKTFGDMRIHKAIDIACKENSQVLSVSNGTVTEVRDSAEYNKIVTIDHGDGYTVEYCGLGTTAVSKGETVGAGVLIGTAKNPPCECLDECHIHIVCLKDGVPFDPVSLYSQNQ